MNTTWLEFFKPKKISDLETNPKAVQAILNWIKNFNNIKNTKPTTKSSIKSCLLITGNHGVGKSVTIEVILQELNYDIHYTTTSDIKNCKNTKDYMNKILNNTNIIHMMQKQTGKNIAIIIDELETISSINEKQFLLSLQKLNELNWFCPMIFISNNQHNKLLSDIKKISLEIRLWPPNFYDMKKILTRIIKSKKILITDPQVLDIIIHHAQDDIRRLIFILQDVKYAYKNKLITHNNIQEYIKISKLKDTDIDLYKATNGLLFEYNNINECLRYYETEKVLLPLMMHQNYIKANISENNILKTIAESLSTGDVVENYIYSDQTWDMQEIHGFYTCVIPSFYLNQDNKSNKKQIRLDFAKDLNRTSIKKINKKNINITDRCFKNMNIFDYIYINKIIRKLILDKNIPECVNLLKNYNIELKYLESLLKIDKIEETKTVLTSKQKNEFSALIKIK